MRVRKYFGKEYAAYAIALMLVIAIGAYVRTSGREDLMHINLAGYFYYRTAHLVNQGEYLKEDVKGRYMAPYKEDYPPFLALFSAALYKLSFSKNLIAFLSFFPVIMFILIALAGFLALSELFGKATGLFFAMLFAFMPAAVEVTGKGFYTEDALGIFLLIGFVYCLAKLEDGGKFLYGAISLLTLFILTWQTFVIVYAALFFIAILSLKNAKLLKRLLAVITIPLVLSYLISVVFMGLDYSPVQIAKETYLSFTINKDFDYRVAFDRSNLTRTSLGQFFKEYSYFSVFLVLGFLVCLRDYQKFSLQAISVLSFFGIISVLIYLKLHYFALPMIAVLSSMGIGYLYDIKKADKKIVSIFVVIIIIFVVVQSILFLNALREPNCRIELKPPEEIKASYPYRISMAIKNTGGDPLCDENYSSSLHAFGGVHVEIENARILSKKIYSKYTRANIVDKEEKGDVRWFEAKLDCLKSLKTANLTFEILPEKTPVKIRYRCWMPDECDLEAPEDLLPEYRVAWRNENCIKRQPTKGEYCKVDVFAGHKTKQKYYCYSSNIG